MSKFNDLPELLMGVNDNEKTTPRVKAFTLRLLIQTDEENGQEFIPDLLGMGNHPSADNKWAALRALRNDTLNPFPPGIESRSMNELAGRILVDEFEWRDVQTQAILVLGDIAHHRPEAMIRLNTAYKPSLRHPHSPRHHRGHSHAWRTDEGRKQTKELDESIYNDFMLNALEDPSPDIRSRAYVSLRYVLGPKDVTNLIVGQLLTQSAATDGQIEALRSLEDSHGRSTNALRDHLFDPTRKMWSGPQRR